MNEITYRLLLLVGFLLVLSPMIRAQAPPRDCAQITYENQNQIDPPPLKITKVSGKVIDMNSVPITSSCVAIFREADKKLVKVAKTDRSGRFSISGISNGRYRLVVTVPGFCPANARVIINRSRGRKTLVTHMSTSAIDTCSFADYK
jgi:hypothetical protein